MGTPWWSSHCCFLRFDNEFEKGFSEALGEDGGLVGEGLLEVVLQTVEGLGYQLPFLIGTEFGVLQEVTNHHVALPESYYIAFTLKNGPVSCDQHGPPRGYAQWPARRCQSCL